MNTDLLETLQVITKLGIQGVGHDLRVLAILDILLSVEEPVGDLVLARIGHNCHKLVNLRKHRTPMILLLLPNKVEMMNTAKIYSAKLPPPRTILRLSLKDQCRLYGIRRMSSDVQLPASITYHYILQQFNVSSRVVQTFILLLIKYAKKNFVKAATSY